MRSYGQYCAVAKALDVVGDRWSLLIVRELLLREACRYTDLLEGLPGIATNLLADRLRELESAGVVCREGAPPPIAATLFRLTDRGRELRPAVHALLQWGGPLLGEDLGDDEFRSYWLALPLESALADRGPDVPPVTLEVRAGEERAAIEVADGKVRSYDGAADEPDVILTGPPRLILGTLVRKVDLERARELGLGVEGDLKKLNRLLRPAVTA